MAGEDPIHGPSERPKGPEAQRVLWALIGVETLALLGTELAIFGVSVWIYEATQSVYAYSALLLANTVPGLLISPLAGHVVDSRSRKHVMIGASIVALLGTLVVLGSAVLGHLSIVPIVIGAAIASVGEAFQFPALAATVPLLTTEEELPRYNGFLESGRAASTLVGPILGGVTFAFIGVKGLLGIEVATFILTTAVIATLNLPQPTSEELEEEDDEEDASPADLLFGLRWIIRHKPLLKVLCAAVFANFILSIGTVLMTPYCLGIVSEQAYGVASGIFGGGMIVGGLLYGPLAKRFKNGRIFLFGIMALGLLYSGYGFARGLPSLAIIEFGLAVLITVANTAILTVWQLKVPEAYSGRVLSAMWMIAESTSPIAFLLAGPIGDSLVPYVLGRPGSLTHWIGTVWGTSKTDQIGTLFSAIGVLLFLAFAIAALSKDVREVEDCPIEAPI
jgi:MFS family permease